MKLTTVNVPEGLVQALDHLVKEGLFPNRSEAIRAAIRRFLDEHRNLRKTTGRLRDIAIDELERGHHGGFLTHFLEAYIRADPSNERIVRLAMETLVQKYELKPEG